MDGEDGLSKNAVKVEWSATANATMQQGASASLAVQPGTSESVVVEPGTSKSGVTEVEAANESGNESSGRATPDSSCSICLGAVVNKSFTDSCMHQFCFTCLKQWSKPGLAPRAFHLFRHLKHQFGGVHLENDKDIKDAMKTCTSEETAEFNEDIFKKLVTEVKAECPLCKQNFKSIYYNVRSIDDYQQYVLPLPAPRTFVMVNFPQEEERIDVYRRRMSGEAAVSSYLDYVVRLEETMNFFSLPRIAIATNRRPQRRRIAGTSNFRRNIYQQGLWVQRQPDVTGRIRESSPEFYRANPAMVHRLVPWLNRELNVLCGVDSQEAMTSILQLILIHPIRCPCFADQIARYTGRHTEHFVHEFHSYATTPYDLVGYDREANYVSHDNLAHMFTEHTVSSDEDVQEVTPTWSAAPTVPINLGSDSDDCVIVDTVQPQTRAPEVITLESDDDVDQAASTSTSSVPQPRQGRSCTYRPVKEGVLVTPTARRRRRLNVSININLPGPSQSRARPSHRRRFRYTPESDSSSEYGSPDRKRPSKKPSKKKPKPATKVKDKTLRKASKGSPQREDPVPNNNAKSSKEELTSMLPLKKRRQRLVVLNSSSDDEPSVLQIDAEPDLLALVEPDVPENKPRLKSVVVKPEIKTETQDCDDFPSTSFHDSPEVEAKSKYFVKKYHTVDSDSSDNNSWHSSNTQLSGNSNSLSSNSSRTNKKSQMRL